MDPVDLTVLSRDGNAKCLRLHRRFDSYSDRIFIMAEETAETGAPAVRAGRQTLQSAGAHP
jgi:hypothetical protein